MEDEKMEPVAEGAAADQQDSFSAGWGEADGAEGAKAQEDRSGSQEPEDAGEQGGDAPAVEDEPEVDPETKPGDEAEEGGKPPAETDTPETEPTRWTVNHLGETTVLEAKDITPELLQKGMDYDRVREKYDEAKPIVAMFSAFAQKAGMSVAEYARSVRLEAKKAEGMSPEQAQSAIELEDREAAVQAAEAKQKEAAEVQEAGKAKLQRDIAAFSEAFPEAYAKAQSDPAAIPQEVWDAVNGGKSLVAAYAGYVAAQAQREADAAKEREATAKKNAENAKRSAGSMTSAGGDTKSKDPFEEGWNS